MAQQMMEVAPDYKCKKKSPKKKHKEEHNIIENGFRRDLSDQLKKDTAVMGDNGDNKVIVCNVLPCDMNEIREMDKWLLPDHSLSKYTCAMEGHEYTILIDLDPYSMFINDEKIEPRLTNGDAYKSTEDHDAVESPEKDDHHVWNDTGLKSYSCNVCKEECPCTKKSFQKYKHRWEVAYECEVCLMKLKTGASLVSHMKTHKKKLHHCTLCNKPFQCKTSVKRHMRTHYTVNEPHIEPDNGIDDIMIYNAYTKILRLSKDADGLESEMEEYKNSWDMEYQEQLDNSKEVPNEQENQEQSTPENKSPKMQKEIKSETKILSACEKAKESLNIKTVDKKPPITLKIKKERLDVGELLKRDQLKREKKKKKQARERLLRLKRRNRELNAAPLKPEEPTRHQPERNRKPPPRFNGADVKEEFSSDDDLPDEDDLGNVAKQSVKTEDSDSEELDELDEDPAYNPIKDDPSFYVPKIKIKKEHLSGAESEHEPGEISDSSFDPQEYLKQRNKKKPWVCEICGNNYSRRNSLQRHYLVHSMEKPYHCDLCEKSFCMQSYLTAHRKIHFERKKVKCTECSREFTRSSNLRAHMIVHVDFKPFSCRVCSKRFSHTSNLKRHEILHTGLKLHVCILCGKGFSLPSGLKEHMGIHDDAAEPFRCDHCNKDFKEYKKLRRHIDLHINDKKFLCLVCNRGFHQKSGLKRHLLTHTEAEREETGADMVAKPKDHKVCIIDAPEEMMAPVVKDILNHVDIQKISDAVQALDHELQIIKAFKSEADEEESQTEENSNGLTQGGENNDDSEQTYTVEDIERELGEVAKTVSDLTKSYAASSLNDLSMSNITTNLNDLCKSYINASASLNDLSKSNAAQSLNDLSKNNVTTSSNDLSQSYSTTSSSYATTNLNDLPQSYSTTSSNDLSKSYATTSLNNLPQSYATTSYASYTNANVIELAEDVGHSEMDTSVSQSERETSVRPDEGYVSAPLERSGSENLISTHWIKKEVLNGGLPVGSCMGNNSLNMPVGSYMQNNSVNSHLTLPNEQHVQENAYPMMYGGYGGPVTQNPEVINIAHYYTNKFFSNGFTNSEVPYQGANK